MPAITRLPEDPDALVDIQGVLAVLPVSSRMTVWRWVQQKKFPPPIRAHNGRNYWRALDVRGWLKNQAAKQRFDTHKV